MEKHSTVNNDQPEILMELSGLCVSFAMLGTGQAMGIFSWNPLEVVATSGADSAGRNLPTKFVRFWDESGSLGHAAVIQAVPRIFSRAEKAVLEKVGRCLGRRQFPAWQSQQRDFVYGLLHDLRGPLRRVGSIMEFVTEANTWPPELQGSVDREIHSAEWVLRQAGVVASTLKDWSGERCEPGKAWSEATYRVHHLYPELRAEYSLEANCDGFAALPEEALTEVLVQLIHNSLKFGGAPCRIWASIRSGGFDPANEPASEAGGESADGCEQGVRIEIRDNGASLDPAHLPKVFRPFYRGHAPSYPGAGLGLFACREIVRRARGRIDAELDPDSGGLRLSLWLPFG
jgi:signal transduction histidine kinase